MPRLPPVTTATRAMLRSSTLDAHRHTHAASNAQGCDAFPGIAPAHLMEQRGQNARAGSPDRMAKRNCAAIDIDDIGVPAHVLVDRASLSGECLVGLDQ